MLLERKVSRSKIAAGHVGVALQTSSCQVGMQILWVFSCAEAWHISMLEKYSLCIWL